MSSIPKKILMLFGNLIIDDKKEIAKLNKLDFFSKILETKYIENDEFISYYFQFAFWFFGNCIQELIKQPFLLHSIISITDYIIVSKDNPLILESLKFINQLGDQFKRNGEITKFAIYNPEIIFNLLGREFFGVKFNALKILIHMNFPESFFTQEKLMYIITFIYEETNVNLIKEALILMKIFLKNKRFKNIIYIINLNRFCEILNCYQSLTIQIVELFSSIIELIENPNELEIISNTTLLEVVLELLKRQNHSALEQYNLYELLTNLFYIHEKFDSNKRKLLDKFEYLGGIEILSNQNHKENLDMRKMVCDLYCTNMNN